MDLREEAVKEGRDDDAETMDVGARISVRYARRAVGILIYFYNMTYKYSAYARMVMYTLQNRN